MRLLRSIFFLAVLAAISTSSLHAEVGIYGMLDVTHVSNPQNTGNSSAWRYGPGVGVYYDFIHLGPASIGVDLRGKLLFGSNNQRFRDGLFGVRVAVKPPLLPLRPYIQGSVGVGGLGETGFHGVGIAYTNKLEYELLGGVDVPVFPHLEWRVVEAGYGRIPGISANFSTSSASLVSLSSGLVLRLP